MVVVVVVVVVVLAAAAGVRVDNSYYYLPQFESANLARDGWLFGSNKQID